MKDSDGNAGMLPEVLTLQQVAEYLQMPVSLVVKHVRRREIPAAKIGREWRVRKAMLDRWLDEQADVNVFALEWLIEETQAAAQEAGIRTDEDVDRLVAEVRAERRARGKR